MSQHDFNIANQSFPATRTDLNNALVALASNSSGDNEPATKYANQFWYETDTNTLKLRNEANDAWISIATLDQSGNSVQSITTAGLTLGSTAISATGAEINQLDAITRGSILYGNASGATARLAAGGASTVLTSDGTDISWAAAGGGGATEFITSSGEINNAASAVFTAFDSSKYDNYIFYLQYVTPATDNASLHCQVSTDGGSNYDTTDTNYVFGINDIDYGSPGYRVAHEVGSATNESGVCGTFSIFGPHRNVFTMIRTNIVFHTSGTGVQVKAGYISSPQEVAGIHKVAADVDAVRFLFSSGNIETGEITMLGIKNA